MVAFTYPCYSLLPGPSVTVQQLHKGHVKIKNEKRALLNYSPQAIIEVRSKNSFWLLVWKTFTNIWYKLTASTPIQKNVVKIK